MTTPTGWYQAPKWAQKALSSLTILALVILSAGPLLAAQPAYATVVTHPTPGTNPTLANSCGLDIALVVDVSQSISSGELTSMKTALNGFVTTLTPTPSMFSVTKFARTGTVVNAFTTDASATTVAINGLAISGVSGTNFEDGLLKANSTFSGGSAKPNVIIFASDGNPNRTGTTGVSATESVARDAAVTQANAIKTSGTRIITLGIGNDLDAQNLKDISSNDAYYTSADFANAGTALSQIALDLCGGTITVQKMIDQDGNPETTGDLVAASTGWNFTVGATPATTDNTGKTPAVDLVQGNYTVSESGMTGYTFESASCTNQSEASLGTQGASSVTGVHVGPFDIVSCTFINKPNAGTLTVVKHVAGEGAPNTADDFTINVSNATPGAFDGNEAGTEVSVPAGSSYVVSEAEHANYTTTMTGDCQGTMTAGGSALCTVTNTYVPPVQQCNLNASHTLVSDSTTLHLGNATVPVDIDGADGNQIHTEWTATIPGATWIWSSNPPTDTVNDLIESFTKTFTIVGTPNADATLTIAADNSYSVDVNGNLAVCADATENNFATADTCVIPQADLQTGSNTITFTVKNWAQSEGTAQSNPAGLMYSLTYNANECDLGATCVPGVNLLANPSFEANAVSAGSWDIFPSGNVALAWLVSWLNPTGAPAIANAEIQSTGLLGVTASNGSQWTELDSDWDGPSGSLSGESGSVSLSQNIATVPGKTYNVSFDFMPRPDTGLGQNGVNVLKDGVSIGIATAPANAPWAPFSYSFVATGATTNVAFADAGTPSDSIGTLLDNASVTCQADVQAPTTARIIASKVVCDSEAYLPNWGAGVLPGNASVGATTATDFVAASNNHCHLVPDWNFQWAPASAGNPGDNVEHAAAPWTTFGPTSSLTGKTQVDVTVGDASYVWVREELKPGFVPFTFGTEDGSDSNNVSAELYCNVDHLHYDNWDRVDNLVAGNTYYCVAFNAPVVSTPVPQCSDDADNDEDQLVDANDPGCMSGPDNTYNPLDNDESNSSETPTDVCTNLPENQSTVPEGYHAVGNQCVLDGAPACSDGIDNDDAEDSLVDSADPGCHLDNDASNSGSYNPTGTNEGNSDGSTPPGGGGGGGNPNFATIGGGPIGGGNGQVLGASCGLFMGQHLRFGSNKNNKEQVSKLQTFLNEQGFGPIPVTGFFGPLTEAAVKAFQQKYADQILTPWSLNAPTGLVYLLTLWKINHISCPDLIDDLPSSLVPWSANPNAQ